MNPIAQTLTTGDVAWSVVVLLALVSFLASYVLGFFVIWSRRDWGVEWRIVATVALAIGVVVLPLVSLILYSIADIVTRGIRGGQRILWIAGIIVTLGMGSFVYFIWALRNKPEAPETGPPAESITAGPRTLTAADLEYLRNLSELHQQGVLTDEQYEEQRRRRVGD